MHGIDPCIQGRQDRDCPGSSSQSRRSPALRRTDRRAGLGNARCDGYVLPSGRRHRLIFTQVSAFDTRVKPAYDAALRRALNSGRRVARNPRRPRPYSAAFFISGYAQFAALRRRPAERHDLRRLERQAAASSRRRPAPRPASATCASVWRGVGVMRRRSVPRRRSDS